MFVGSHWLSNRLLNLAQVLISASWGGAHVGLKFSLSPSVCISRKMVQFDVYKKIPVDQEVICGGRGKKMKRCWQMPSGDRSWHGNHQKLWLAKVSLPLSGLAALVPTILPGLSPASDGPSHSVTWQVLSEHLLCASHDVLRNRQWEQERETPSDGLTGQSKRANTDQRMISIGIHKKGHQRKVKEFLNVL